MSPLPHLCLSLSLGSAMLMTGTREACGLTPVCVLVLREMLTIALQFYVLMQAQGWNQLCEKQIALKPVVKWRPHAGNWLAFCPQRGWWWVLLVSHTGAGSGTAAVDVPWEPHLFVNLKEQWGWVFHSLQRKRKERNHFLSVKSCVSSFINFSLPENNKKKAFQEPV